MKISIEGGRLIIETGALLAKKTQEIPIPQIKKISQERRGLSMKVWTVSTVQGTYTLPSTPANDRLISRLRDIMDGVTQPSYVNPQTPYFNVQMNQPQSPPVTHTQVQNEVVKIRCSHCRTLNPDTNQTCMNCGARL